MFTLTFDESKEIKKSDVKLNSEESVIWDYASEIQGMHIIPAWNGYIKFYGDTCNLSWAKCYSHISEILRELRSVSDEAFEYAKLKKPNPKKYHVEFVAWRSTVIEATDDVEARRIANEEMSRINNDEDYCKSIGAEWNSCDIHAITDCETDRIICYN